MPAELPVLETERLVLRPFTPDDLDALVDLHAEPSFWRYPMGRGMRRDETEQWMRDNAALQREDGWSMAAVVVRNGGDLAGWAGLAVPHFLPALLPAVEVGWRLGCAYWGHGYATEAGRAWVDYGFGPGGLTEIISIYEPANLASGAVMDRLGFRPAREIAHPTRGEPLRITKLVRSDATWTGEAR